LTYDEVSFAIRRSLLAYNRVSLCIYTYMYIYMYVYMHTHTHTHTHTHYTHEQRVRWMAFLGTNTGVLDRSMRHKVRAFSKVLSTVILCGTHTRPLNFQNARHEHWRPGSLNASQD